MAAIDIGYGTVYSGSDYSGGNTSVGYNNPANASGVLDSFSVYFVSGYDGAGVKIGTFYGATTTWYSRDYESLGSVAGGSTQTFTGKDCDVETNDCLGLYCSSGRHGVYGAGSMGFTPTNIDCFDGAAHTYSAYGTNPASYATGSTTPTTIDVGSPAVSGLPDGVGYTVISTVNYANGTGILDTFQIYVTTPNATGVVVGTSSGAIAGFDFTTRDSESIGTVTCGSTQTFTGKNCDVVFKDYITHYVNGGSGVDYKNGGATSQFWVSGNKFGAGATSYTGSGSGYSSVYGSYGEIIAPTVTTQAASSVSFNTLIGNGTITSLGPDAGTRGFCYKAGTSGDPTTSDATAYDSGTFGTGAYTKAIAGLSEVTSYRVRAYAVSLGGTGYGTSVSVVTLGAPTMTRLYLENARRNRLSRQKVSGGVTK